MSIEASERPHNTEFAQTKRLLSSADVLYEKTPEIMADRVRYESEWYAQHEFKDALLAPETDHKWMAAIAGHEFDGAWLKRINELVGIGSASCRQKFSGAESVFETSEDLHPAIIEARREFFEVVLGLEDLVHPLHDAYMDFQERKPSLIPLATFIGTQRLLASEGLDNELFLSLGDKSFSAGPERLASVLECMHELGLDAKQMQKRSSYSLTADPKRIKDSFRVLGSHEDLDAVKLLNNAPMLVWTAPDEIKSRIKNLQKKGLKPRMINANAKVLLVDNERINNRIAKYKNLGLNYEFIINSDMFALTSSDELIDARIDGLNAMGLDAIRCINACPSLLNTKTERVRSKLLIVRAILRYYGSEKPAEEIVHKFPAILVRSAEKLRSTVRMLAGSVDDKYMATEGVEELDKYMIIPTDTLFLAVAIHRTQEFSPGGLTASSIRIVRREVSAKETRGRILEILSDAGARRTVGARAVNTYLASSPLTGQERARYSWHEA